MARPVARKFRHGLVSRVAVLAALFLLPLAPGKHGEAAPDRLLLEARDYPWSAIGRINTAGRGFCTGFLVGPSQVLTAAHCLYNFQQGRWYQPLDVHFVAGYQRDTFLKHSRAKAYEVHPSYRPRKVPKVTDTLKDWALVSLAKPVGREVGWLGLSVLDRDSFGALESGRAIAVQAGYRRDRPHAISAGVRCDLLRVFGEGRGLIHDCDVVEGASGSPLLLVRDGKVTVLGLHTVRTENDAGEAQAGALAVSVFHPEYGNKGALTAAKRIGLRWSEGQAPGDDGDVRPATEEAIEQLFSGTAASSDRETLTARCFLSRGFRASPPRAPFGPCGSASGLSDWAEASSGRFVRAYAPK